MHALRMPRAFVSQVAGLPARFINAGRSRIPVPARLLPLLARTAGLPQPLARAQLAGSLALAAERTLPVLPERPPVPTAVIVRAEQVQSHPRVPDAEEEETTIAGFLCHFRTLFSEKELMAVSK